MRVRVLSRAEVERGGAEGADAVISIRATADVAEPELAAALAQATRGETARLHRMTFDDIGMEVYGDFRGPTMTMIADVIAFGRSIVDGRNLFDGPCSDPLIAVHCEHGRSRSAAIALVLLADHYGAGREHDAVNELMRADVEGRMHPNPAVVGLADACMFRYGRLDAALMELSPRYVTWRDSWREIAANSDVYWRQTVKMLKTKRRRAP